MEAAALKVSETLEGDRLRALLAGDCHGGSTMISIKRRTLVVLLCRGGARAGAVTWGTETADVGKRLRDRPRACRRA